MDFGLARVSAEKVAAGEQGATTITVDSEQLTSPGSAVGLGIAAGILFGFGMIAGPLTPSEGQKRIRPAWELVCSTR